MKPLPGVFFLLSPLVLSFPSFSDKFISVAKLQLVKVKYVTQQWPVIAAFFFTITRQSNASLRVSL